MQNVEGMNAHSVNELREMLTAQQRMGFKLVTLSCGFSLYDAFLLLPLKIRGRIIKMSEISQDQVTNIANMTNSLCGGE